MSSTQPRDRLGRWAAMGSSFGKIHGARVGPRTKAKADNASNTGIGGKATTLNRTIRGVKVKVSHNNMHFTATGSGKSMAGAASSNHSAFRAVRSMFRNAHTK